MIFIIKNVENREEHIESQYNGCTFGDNNSWNGRHGRRHATEDLNEEQEYAEYEEVTESENLSGRKKSHLFSDQNGAKDEKLTAKMSTIFREKLYEHVPKEDVMIETHLNNGPSSLFIEFYLMWMDEGLVERYVNGRACYRFLTEDCCLPCGSTEKHFSDWVKKIIIQRI